MKKLFDKIMWALYGEEAFYYLDCGDDYTFPEYRVLYRAYRCKIISVRQLCIRLRRVWKAQQILEKGV